MVLIEREAVLAEFNSECADVVKMYDNAPAYRDAVLEGLRVAKIIILSEAAKPRNAKELGTSPNRPSTPCCYQCGNDLNLRYWCYDCNDMSHPA